MIWRPLPAPPKNGDELSGAPYDGEPVDLWIVAPRKEYRIADAWWETSDDPGWYVRVSILREPMRVYGATHWMPLPPGPSTSRREGVRRRLTWVIYGLTIAMVVGVIYVVACAAMLVLARLS